MKKNNFLEEFKDIEDLVKEFKCDKIRADLDTANIHIAWYGCGSYCGNSYVLYEKNGTLYENEASHCSCYGLEGQWSPNETCWEAISKRKFYDEYNGSQEANLILSNLLKEYLNNGER